jgi:N-acetylglucosaminyldiphosphoundecaprenol N-acetyl-beta-D-mannosaminyltransferase
MSQSIVEIMGVKIFSGSFDSAIDQMIQFLNEEKLHMICTPNTEFIMRAQDDHEFKTILNASDLNIPDGFGLILASKLNGLGIEEKIAGVEFMERTLKYCHQENRSIFLFGGSPESLENAAENIRAQFEGISVVGTRHGYFKPEDDRGILEEINLASPDVLFVALGSPKQERWINRYRDQLKVRVAIGVGGSIDIWSGEATRAPKIFIDLGLEWFYRLVRQPSRIGRMMVIPRFLIKLGKERIINH